MGNPWLRKLRPLLDRFPKHVVARQVLCVEYFGYHSGKFAHQRLLLPSQLYGFHLVKQAILRGSIVVVTRGYRLWLEAVPELKEYRHFRLRNPQNTAISAGNCPDGFSEIVARLANAE